MSLSHEQNTDSEQQSDRHSSQNVVNAPKFGISIPTDAPTGSNDMSSSCRDSNSKCNTEPTASTDSSNPVLLKR